MVPWQWLVIGVAVSLVLYATAVLALVIAGRRADAVALVRLVPDCVVLLRRLCGDPRVAWWRKTLLVGLIAYLAMPIDLVPDVIPVAGQLDDAILVALVLRVVLRGAGEPLLREHWPGSQASLDFIRRLAYDSTQGVLVGGPGDRLLVERQQRHQLLPGDRREAEPVGVRLLFDRLAQ